MLSWLLSRSSQVTQIARCPFQTKSRVDSSPKPVATSISPPQANSSVLFGSEPPTSPRRSEPCGAPPRGAHLRADGHGEPPWSAVAEGAQGKASRTAVVEKTGLAGRRW